MNIQNSETVTVLNFCWKIACSCVSSWLSMSGFFRQLTLGASTINSHISSFVITHVVSQRQKGDLYHFSNLELKYSWLSVSRCVKHFTSVIYASFALTNSWNPIFFSSSNEVLTISVITCFLLHIVSSFNMLLISVRTASFNH